MTPNPTRQRRAPHTWVSIVALILAGLSAALIERARVMADDLDGLV